MATEISSSKNNFAFSDNEYGYITMSATQTTPLTNGSVIKFDTLSAGNVTFNPVTYQVTLKKNRTYVMRASVFADFSGTTGTLCTQFYNVTTSALVGIKSDIFTVTYASAYSIQPAAFLTITPTVDTVIEIHIVSPTALADIYNLQSYWEIQQINIISPVIQDISTTLQAGIVMAYAGTVIPVGWLNCDGSLVSTGTYATLYAAIGTTWGSGSGTFALPDLRSATIRGVGTPSLYTSNTVISLAQLLDDKIQGHYHAINDPTHSHPLEAGYNFSSSTTRQGVGPGLGYAAGYVSAASATGVTVTAPTADPANGTPRVGLETTGKARGLYYIIKY